MFGHQKKRKIEDNDGLNESQSVKRYKVFQESVTSKSGNLVQNSTGNINHSLFLKALRCNALIVSTPRISVIGDIKLECPLSLPPTESFAKNLRNTRIGIVKVISDLKSDVELKVNKSILEDNIKKLIAIVRKAAKQSPLIFTPKPGSDAVTVREVKEFSAFVSVGLSSLFFVPSCKQLHSEICTFISDTLAIISDESIRAYIINNLLHILSQIVVPTHNRLFSCTMDYHLHVPVLRLRYRISINDSNEYGALNIFTILSPLIHWSEKQQIQLYYDLLYRAWMRFKTADKFCLLNNFTFPQDVYFEGENCVYHFVCHILEDSLQENLKEEELFLLEIFLKRFIGFLPFLPVDVISKIFYCVSIIAFFPSNYPQSDFIFKILKAVSSSSYSISKELDSIKNWAVRNYFNKMEMYHPFMVDVVATDTVNYIEYNVFERYDYQDEQQHHVLTNEDAVYDADASLLELSHIGENLKASTQNFSPYLTSIYSKVPSTKSQLVLSPELLFAVAKKTLPFLTLSSKARQDVQEFVHLEKGWTLRAELIPTTFMENWSQLSLWAVALSPTFLDKSQRRTITKMTTGALANICDFCYDVYKVRDAVDISLKQTISSVLSLSTVSLCLQGARELSHYRHEFPLREFLQFHNATRGDEPKCYGDKELINNLFEVIKKPIIRDVEGTFVIALVDKIFENFEDSTILILLELIGDFWWPIRSISFLKILSFLSKVIWQRWWKFNELEGRVEAIAKAIVRLPCIYSNRRKLVTGTGNLSHLYTLNGCRTCDFNDDGGQFYDRKLLSDISKFAKLLITEGGEEGSIIVLDVLTTIHNHCNFQANFLPKLIPLLKLSNGKVLLKLFQVVSALGQDEEETVNYKPPTPFRLSIVNTFAESLRKYVIDFRQRRDRVKASAVILQLVHNHVEVSDEYLMIEMIRLSVYLIVICLNDGISESVGKMFYLFSKKLKCSPSDIFFQQSQLIAKAFLEAVSDHIYPNSPSENKTGTDKVVACFIQLQSCSSCIERHFIKEFVPTLLKVVISGVEKCLLKKFVLTSLKDYCHLSIQNILQNVLVYIYPYIITDGDYNSCAKFLKDQWAFDMDEAAKQQILNLSTEMMCHLYKNKAKLVYGLGHIVCWDSELERNNQVPTLAQVQEVIGRRIWGIFSTFNRKLTSKSESLESKRRVVLAFTEVISTMGPILVSQHRSKIYAALIAMFILGPKYYDLLATIWMHYIVNLDDKSLPLMCTQIVSAILTFYPTHPSETETLIKYLTEKRTEIVINCGATLHFLRQYFKKGVAITRIKNTVDNLKREHWLDFFELLVRECGNQSVYIRYQNMKALRDLIKTEESLLIKNVLLTQHSSISQLIMCLLKASRDESRVKSLAAECLGIIGALSPKRFWTDSSVSQSQYWQGPREFTLATQTFRTKYLEELVNIFEESEDTIHFDSAACCIQDIIKLFHIKNSSACAIWGLLSFKAKEIIQPLMDSKLTAEHRPCADPKVTFPIYRSKNSPNYEEWLKTWTALIIVNIKNEEVSPIFNSNRRLIQYSSKLANFIISYAAFYNASLGGERNARKFVFDEIKFVIKLWDSVETVEYSMTQSACSEVVELDDLIHKLNRTEDHFVNTARSGKKSGIQTRFRTKAAKESKEEAIMKLKATKTIFIILDHMYRGVRCLKKMFTLPPHHPSLLSNETSQFSLEKVNCISGLLDEISFEKLAKAAFHSKTYTRALLYLEQHVRKHPNQLTKSLDLMQRIFISLNDMDSAMAVAARRSGKTSFDESIMETMINGKIENVVTCFESATGQNSNDLLAHEGLIQSYLSLDQPHKANILIQHCISKNSSWTHALEECQYSVLLKLGDWKSLNAKVLDTARDTRTLAIISEKNVEESYGLPKWNKHIATTLFQLKKANYGEAQKIIDNLRIHLIETFSSVSINVENWYKAHYKDIIGLHILTEVQQVLDLLKQPDQSFMRLDGIRNMLQRWNMRLHNVQPNEHYFRPILDVRKVLLSIYTQKLSYDAESVDLLNAAVRDCWLFAARQERKKGKLYRSANSLANANALSIDSTEILIESAKLQIQKGAKDKALSILNLILKPDEGGKKRWSRTSSSSYLHPEDTNYETKLKSKALLLFAKLCDEMRVADQETNVANFSAAIKCMKNSEKNYFMLACYLDRLLPRENERTKFSDTNIECLVVQHYSDSLKYGAKYVYQSLPRLLSLWFDFGTVAPQTDDRSVATLWPSSSDRQTDLPKFLDSFRYLSRGEASSFMIRVVDNLTDSVPAYIFMTAFSQLVSRICHSDSAIWNQLSKILVYIITTHPYQSLWMTMTVAKSSYKMRSTRIKEIYKKVQEKRLTQKGSAGSPMSKKNLIQDYTTLSERLIQLSNVSVDKKTVNANIMSLVPALPKLLASKNFSKILVPFEQFLFPKLPAVTNQHKDHNAFPQTAVYIHSIESTIMLMNSLQRPKKIIFRGSDGLRYGMMCKPKDDLRKDCKVMEVNNVINHYLKQTDSGLRVRTYAVVPLNEECGLLEWVNNLNGLRPTVQNIYKERKVGMISRTLMELQCAPNDPIEKKLKVYSEKFLPAHPPVLSEWFLYNFPNHRTWYQARLNFMKTAAVMSIVGYIFGLGDRHGENIMLDTVTGDVVHVDFNCLFLEGENLRYAERVPFRLTQNMLDAMGVCGANGIFKKSCEMTLAMIREHKSIFLSVLRPFVFDPLVEWGEVVTGGTGTNPGEINNSKAWDQMVYIKHRISGTARCQTKITDTELSVEAHVKYLMEEATNAENLCQMYIGWAAFI